MDSMHEILSYFPLILTYLVFKIYIGHACLKAMIFMVFRDGENLMESLGAKHEGLRAENIKLSRVVPMIRWVSYHYVAMGSFMAILSSSCHDMTKGWSRRGDRMNDF